MKNRFTKKTICIFLSMLMVLTCFSAIPITASAEDVTAQAVIDAYNAGLANGTNFTSGTDYTASNANSTNVSIVDNTRFGDVYSLCVALQGVITQLAPSYNHNSYLRPRVKAATGNNAKINALIDLLLPIPSNYNYNSYTPSNHGTWSDARDLGHPDDNCGNNQELDFNIVSTVRRSLSAAVLSTFPGSAADVTGQVALTAKVTTSAHKHHETNVTGNGLWTYYRNCSFWTYNNSVTASTGTLTNTPDLAALAGYEALTDSAAFKNGDCENEAAGIGYEAWKVNSAVVNDMTAAQADSVLAAYKAVNSAAFTAVSNVYKEYYLADNADKTNGLDIIADYDAYIADILTLYRTVTFANYDGSVLYEQQLHTGVLPVYAGEAPVKPITAGEYYVFTGWDAEISEVTDNIVYTAQFSTNARSFTVRFFDENNNQVGEEQTIVYGSPAVAPEALTKAYDETYHYDFDGWDGYQSIVEDTDIYGSFTAVAHTYDEYVENVIPATCATNRTDRFSCTCGKTEDREVADSFDAENHADYGTYNDTVIAATCADTGLMGTYCEGCHALRSSVEIAIDAGNHINQATGEAYGTHDNTITAATCMAEGEKGTYCDGCNALLHTAVIPVNANSHINQVTSEAYGTYDDTITAATCSDTGTMGTYCEGCNALLDTSVIPVNENSHINQATGEVYGTYDNTITAATCSDLGTMGTYCEACNKLLSTADIEKNPANHKDIATGEDYETYDAVITAATCQAEGVMGTYCAGCHELLSTSVIAKDEANHINQETGEAYITYDRVITAATCSDEGTMGTYCAKCYKLISTSAIEKNPENHKNIETNEVYSTYEEVITAATCMAEGTMGTYCEGCHEKLSEAVIAINADNHINQATGEAYGTYSNTITAATCSDEGTMGTYCEGCDKLLSTSVIEKDAANHKDIATGEAYATYDAVITPATCMAEGLMGTYCAGCHEKLSEAVIAINAGNHINQETGEAYATYEEVILAPTCSVSGRLGTFCSECDALISEVSIEKDMENHADYGTYRETVTAATCKNEGVMGIYCYGCGNQVGSEPIAINPNNHTGETELRDIIPATCGTKGFSGNIYCLDCGEMIVAGYVTPYNGDVHTPGEPVNERIVSATCARAGSHDEVVYCSVCNKQISRTNIIDPKTNDHRRSYPEVENIIAATCAHPGTHDEVVYCGICSIELERKTITDAATGDHVYDAGVITTPASCTADGVKTFTCTECGDTYTKPVPALGHIDENSDDVCDRCGEQLGATEPTEPTEPSNPSGVCVCGSTTIHDRSNPIEFFKCMFTYLINMFRSLFTGK